MLNDLLLPAEALEIGPNIFHHHLHENLDHLLERPACFKAARGTKVSTASQQMLRLVHLLKLSQHLARVECFMAILHSGVEELG